MSHDEAALMERSSAERMADGLGYFSLGLGALEVFAPDAVARFLGMQGSESLIRAYGFREIAAGIGILTADNQAPWVWSRVAGDALDVATLVPALSEDNPNRGNAMVALGAVLGATLADVVCAQALTQHNSIQDQRQQRAVRDYSGRSGYPQGAISARGATKDAKIPRDFRVPEPMRPWKDGKPQSAEKTQSMAKPQSGAASVGPTL
jgi:hypothetical protein